MKKSNSFEEISLITEPKGPNWFRGRGKWVILIAVLVVVAIAAAIGGVYYVKHNESKHPCADAAARIIEAALSDSSLAYPRLGYLCHTYGSRLSGSTGLEAALDWMLLEMQNDNLSNVHSEPVSVPNWKRGNEYVNMLTPLNKNLAMLGLGGSQNTSSEGITGRVIVVSSYADLNNKSALIPGNIVLFNVPFTTYGATVQYRSGGADAASKLGAVAALVRSVTPYSLYTPHTGATNYAGGNITKIPFAAITVEDAILMQALYDAGENITVTIYMESHWAPNADSRNVMGQLTGSLYPEKVIAIGGHTDSWDVGQGAMDDGGGILVSWEAVRLLKSLGLTPKRTVRFVGWVNEENGLAGGTAYAAAHVNETHVLAIESDGGATTPLGLAVSAVPDTVDSLQGIANLLKPIGANGIQTPGGGADIGPLQAQGVPVAGLWTDMSKYFWFHHTNADTFDKMDETQMRQCVATMAVMSYCVADADDDLVRTPIKP